MESLSDENGVRGQGLQRIIKTKKVIFEWQNR